MKESRREGWEEREKDEEIEKVEQIPFLIWSQFLIPGPHETGSTSCSWVP